VAADAWGQRYRAIFHQNVSLSSLWLSHLFEFRWDAARGEYRRLRGKRGLTVPVNGGTSMAATGALQTATLAKSFITLAQ